jgi:predicted nucleotidyltransferase
MTNNQENKTFKQNDDDDGVFVTTLETFIFARRLQQYQKTSNKVDKNFATMLLELCATIENFLETAEVEDDENRPNVEELIPSIESCVFQAHRMYFCTACNKNVKANGSSIHSHFLSDSHLKHLKNYAKGLPTLDVAESKQLNSDNIVKDKKKIALPALLKEVGVKDSLPKKMRDFLTSKNVTEFTNALIREGHTLKCSGHFNRICKMIEKHLYHRYPKVKAYAFGSVVNGLGRVGSDLDIFVDTENCFYKRLAKRKMKDAIYQAQRILSNTPHHQWDNFEPVVHARTPILRVFCVAENIDCDLSFSNGLSTCNTSLITYLIDLQPLSKQLIIFLKHWAKQLQIGVNSYLLTLLVIFYLQQETLLPPIQLLQETINEVRIDGWNANFAQMNLSQVL